MEIIELQADQVIRIVPLLRELHDLHAAEQPDRYPETPSEAVLATWLREELETDGMTALIAESPTGAVMGYVLIELQQRPDHPLTYAGTRLMVHHIAVHEPFRRMGVGVALMSEAKRRACAAGARSVVASFSSFNTASEALMRHMGLLPVTTFAEWQTG